MEPTYTEYKAQVDHMVESKELTIEQSIVLTSVYRNWLEGNQTHVNYLMQATNTSWTEINWICNGLVQRGAIKKYEKYYTI